jgi:hypothetical protein
MSLDMLVLHPRGMCCSSAALDLTMDRYPLLKTSVVRLFSLLLPLALILAVPARARADCVRSGCAAEKRDANGCGPSQAPPAGTQQAPPAPACPVGQETNIDTAGHCCWPGQVWGNARCVGIPRSCPRGFTIDKERCAPEACPHGMVHPQNTKLDCCWPGQLWSKVNSVCVGTPQCPRGFEARGDACADLEAEKKAAALAAQQAEQQRQQREKQAAQEQAARSARTEADQAAAAARAEQEKRAAEVKQVLDLGDVQSRLHPRQRASIGGGIGLGFRCVLMTNDELGATCGFMLQFELIDFPIGNAHAFFTFADVKDAYAGTTSNPGGGFGVDLGSMFFPIGGPTSRAAMAIRGQLDASFINAGSLVIGVSLGVAVPFSFAVSRLVSVELKPAIGMFPSVYGDRNLLGGYTQLLAGVRL